MFAIFAQLFPFILLGLLAVFVAWRPRSPALLPAAADRLRWSIVLVSGVLLVVLESYEVFGRARNDAAACALLACGATLAIISASRLSQASRRH